MEHPGPKAKAIIDMCMGPSALHIGLGKALALMLSDCVEEAPGRWSPMTGHEHGLLQGTSLSAVSSGWAIL